MADSPSDNNSMGPKRHGGHFLSFPARPLHQMETIRRHYLLNTFLCEQKTMFAWFRSKKVVTFSHNRDLKMSNTIPIWRVIPIGKDDLIVRVIQIDEVFDYIIIEADEPMFVSEPSLHLRLPQVGHCNIVYGLGA